MGKGGKLGKLIKKWHSSSKLGRSNSSTIAANPCEDSWHPDSDSLDKVPGKLQAVYVGKSRRRYLISSELVDHPLFQVLMDRSSGDSEAMTVGCEVVLFEHLLWMLQNADPQAESLDELVEFYAC
ncbi:auxin-responsive protein SAUR76-like [Aristolochia californica]|uniref:auxin-responsive protein SAUR76-like n=1 Tax=Aristolochia californica TaxID=171875 RepID=UPI0035D75358